MTTREQIEASTRNPPSFNQSDVLSLINPNEVRICNGESNQSATCELLDDDKVSDYNRLFGCPASFGNGLDKSVFSTDFIQQIARKDDGTNPDKLSLTYPPLRNPLFAYENHDRLLREIGLTPLHVVIQNLLIMPGVQFQRVGNGIDYTPCGQLFKNSQPDIPEVSNDGPYDGTNYTGGIPPGERVFISGLEQKIYLNGLEGKIISWTPDQSPTNLNPNYEWKESKADSYDVQLFNRRSEDESLFIDAKNLFRLDVENPCNKLHTSLLLGKLKSVIQSNPESANELNIKFWRLSSMRQDNEYRKTKVFDREDVEESQVYFSDKSQISQTLEETQQGRSALNNIRNHTIAQIRNESIMLNPPGETISHKDDSSFLTIPEQAMIAIGKSTFPQILDDSGADTKMEQKACYSSFMYRDNVCPSLYPNVQGITTGGLVLSEVSNSTGGNVGSLPMWVVDNTPIRGDTRGSVIDNTCIFAVTTKIAPNPRTITETQTESDDSYYSTLRSLVWSVQANHEWNSMVSNATKLKRCIPVPKVAINREPSNENGSVSDFNKDYLESLYPDGLLDLWLMKNQMVITDRMFVDGGFAIPVKLDEDKALLRGMVNLTAIEQIQPNNAEANNKREHLKALYQIDKLKKEGKKGELADYLEQLVMKFTSLDSSELVHGELRAGDLHRINRGAWSSFNPKEANFTDAKLFTEIRDEYHEYIKTKYKRSDHYNGDLEFVILANEGANNAPVDNVGWGKGVYAQFGESEDFGILGVFAHAVFRATTGTSDESERHLIYHNDDRTPINNIYFVPWFCFRITPRDFEEAQAGPGTISTFARYLLKNSGVTSPDIDHLLKPSSVTHSGGLNSEGVIGIVNKARNIHSDVKQDLSTAKKTISSAKSGAMYIGALGAAALIAGISIKLFRNRSKSKAKPLKRKSRIVNRNRSTRRYHK